MKRGKHSFVVLVGCLMFLFQASLCMASNFEENINTCADILQNFIDHVNPPKGIFQDCKGLVILSVGKAGFLFSAQGGGGLVIVKLPDGQWSAPSSIKLGGAGFGFQVGAELTEHVFVLNSDAAVRAFSRGGNITLGADISIAAGPLGRSVAADVTPMAAIFSYSKSKGLFVGASLEGTLLVEGDRTNEDFYGEPVDVSELLEGGVAIPERAERLYNILNNL